MRCVDMTTVRSLAVMELQTVSPWTWQDQFGFVQALSVGAVARTVYCSGQTSVGADGEPLYEDDMRAQIGQSLDNLEVVLREAGCALSDVVRLNYFTTDLERFLEALDVVRIRLEAEGCRPVSTLLEVPRLALPGLLVEIEGTAVV